MWWRAGFKGRPFRPVTESPTVSGANPGLCGTKPAFGAIDMLSKDDIDCLLAIGEQQRTELLALGPDRAPADEGAHRHEKPGGD